MVFVSFSVVKMRILVTGGAGYIGSALIARLRNSYPASELHVIDNLVNSDKTVISWLISNKKIIFRQGSLCDLEFVKREVSRIKPDCVFHLAGYKDGLKSVLHPTQFIENNVIATANLCESMRHAGIDRIIFSSSASVYKSSRFPVHETSDTAPLTPYAWSKLCCEELIRFWVAENLSRKAICLRYFNPCGSSKLIEPKMDFNLLGPSLFKSVIELIRGQSEKFYLFGVLSESGSESPVRDFISIDDLVSAHTFFYNLFDVLSERFNIFNVGSGEPIAVTSVVETLSELTGRSYDVIEARSQRFSIPYSSADISLANGLGWKPKESIRDSLRSLIETYG